MKNYNEFINEDVNDKHDLFDILRNWGVFNPPEFIIYLEEIGYTIIELDPNSTNESLNILVESHAYQCVTCGERAKHEEIKDNPNMVCGNCGNSDWVTEYEYDDGYDRYEDEYEDEYDLKEALEFGNVNLVDLKNDLGYIIIKNQDITNEQKDIRDMIKNKFNPTIKDTINKLEMVMMDVSYHGLRSGLDSSITDKEQYDHITQYILHLKRVLKGVIKLEKRIAKLKKSHKLSSDDLRDFNIFINHVIKESYYRFPWNFKGYLSDFDQEKMDTVIGEFNNLVDRYQGKKIYPKRHEKI